MQGCICVHGDMMHGCTDLIVVDRAAVECRSEPFVYAVDCTGRGLARDWRGLAWHLSCSTSAHMLGRCVS